LTLGPNTPPLQRSLTILDKLPRKNAPANT
jgi:hypothetical protein